MKRKDKHIDKFLRDPLPDPEIPANDAWAGMSDMLNATTDDEMNGGKWPAQFWKSIGKFKGLLIVTSAVVTISAVIALVVFNNHETGNRKTETSDIPSRHGNTAGNVTNTDPVSEKTKTAVHRENTADDVTAANAATGRVMPDISRDESIVKDNHPERKTPVPGAARRIAAQPETRDHTGPARTSSHTRRSDTHARVIRRRNAYVRNPVRENQPDNPLRKNAPVHFESTGNDQELTELPLTNQTNVTPVSHEKTNSPPLAKSLPSSVEPLPGHFDGPKSDLSKLVQKPVPNVAQPRPKTRNSIFANLHFGPEWNINRSVVSTDYMLTGADSNKHPLRLAIPGVFVSKSWNRHTATFIFNPLHSYFGEKERVAQRLDTIPSADSTLQQISRNTNFIKAFGLNFSLQYQYRITRGLSLIGGLSYARYSSALLRKETEYPNGAIVNDAYLTARGREALKSYINPEQWNLRVGILFYSRTVFNNRLQVGMNTIIPLSNLSLGGFKSIKSPNVQMSIRFLIR